MVRSKYVDQFKSDRTFTLILRLHHNVIKTAIRRISLAYSRISLADVAAKLKLESPKDAEYIIAKVNLFFEQVCWLTSRMVGRMAKSKKMSKSFLTIN